MAVKAYVLMNLAVTNIAEALNEVKGIKGVKLTDAVTGPYDAIIQVEAANMDELGRLVTTKVLKVKGVVKTLTCVAV